MTMGFVCPLCFKHVDPTTPNAELNALSKLWQHKDCALKERVSGESIEGANLSKQPE